MATITEGNLGDSAIPISVQLFRGTVPYNASGIPLANIVFTFKKSGAIIATAPAETADDAATGKFSLTPPAAVRGVVGTYVITVVVTELDGKVQTFPKGVENRYSHKIVNP